jgi:hypothetical protein
MLLAVLVVIPVVFVAAQRSSEDNSSEVNRHWATLEDHDRAQTSENTDLRASSFVPVLDRTRVRRLRTSMTEMLGGPQVATLDFGSLRWAKTDYGTSLWLVSSGDIHCLVVGLGLGVSCTPTSTAQRKGITVGLTKASSPTEAPRLFLLTGMVPDGVRAVRLRVGKRASELAVRNNTFELRAQQPIQVYGVIQQH